MTLYTNNTKNKSTIAKSFLLFSLFTSSLLISPMVMAAENVSNSDDVISFTLEKEGRKVNNHVAYVPFSGDDAIANQIYKDLRTTSLKTSTGPFFEQPNSSAELKDSLPSWQQLGIPFLVVGSISTNGSISTIKYEVVDVATGNVQSESITGSNKIALSHKAAGRIFEIITGKPTDLTAQLIYVEKVWEGKDFYSRLILRNADGSNPRVIDTLKNATIYTPAVAPDGSAVVLPVQKTNSYITLFKKSLYNFSNPPLKLVDIANSSQSPTYSPDGSIVLFSNNNDGDYDIYAVNSHGGAPQKIEGLDLAYDQLQPSIAPDGTILFLSDHLTPKRPSLYSYNNGQLKKVTAGSYSANGNFSPDGSKIGYLSGSNAVVISNTGALVKNFGNTGIDEAPRFSPNGERVVYSQGKGKSTILIRSLKGGDTVQLETNGEVNSVVWVPTPK